MVLYTLKNHQEPLCSLTRISEHTSAPRNHDPSSWEAILQKPNATDPPLDILKNTIRVGMKAWTSHHFCKSGHDNHHIWNVITFPSDFSVSFTDRVNIFHQPPHSILVKNVATYQTKISQRAKKFLDCHFAILLLKVWQIPSPSFFCANVSVLKSLCIR